MSSKLKYGGFEPLILVRIYCSSQFTRFIINAVLSDLIIAVKTQSYDHKS